MGHDRVDHSASVRGARGFAAAPHEHPLAPRVVSTLFPHLPRQGHDSFRVLLALGAALIASLALAGLFPVALIASAVLVPLLVVLYFREVDVYEGEPLGVLVLTVAWGAVTGVGMGLLAEVVRSADATLVSPTTGHAVLWRGVLIPLIGFGLVLLGPLALLRYKAFDDVLDGVTFGGACAVSFAGAELLTHSSTFLASGLEPAGLVTPWVLRLLTLGLAVPVLAAAAVGAASGAVWLRYRAPRRDRGRLGLLGNPLVALPLGALLLIGSALLQLYLSRWAALAAVVVVAGAAVVWLRQLIHLGLLEEAAEVEIGPEVTCANCGRLTRRHSFCAHCGVSLRALPKSPRHPRGGGRGRLLARFGVALAALIGVAAAVMAGVQPGAARPPCPAGVACADPPRAPVPGPPSLRPLSRIQVWRSSLGVRLSFDAGVWRVVGSTDRRLALIAADQLALTIEAQPAGGATDQQLLVDELVSLRDRYPDLELDRLHQPAATAIGSVPGGGEALVGHDLDGRPVEALIEAATRGAVTVLVTALTSQQAHTSANGAATPFDILVGADAVLETFRWPGQAALSRVRRRA
ncbi:MAG: hypothetical protein E6J20_18665 [Chloroflexi bacterium]|nr:MAG: hypothetical protein E6J20_18665 [Chloroflexota bacterium]